MFKCFIKRSIAINYIFELSLKFAFLEKSMSNLLKFESYVVDILLLVNLGIRNFLFKNNVFVKCNEGVKLFSVIIITLDIYLRQI